MDFITSSLCPYLSFLPFFTFWIHIKDSTEQYKDLPHMKYITSVTFLLWYVLHSACEHAFSIRLIFLRKVEIFYSVLPLPNPKHCDFHILCIWKYAYWCKCYCPYFTDSYLALESLCSLARVLYCIKRQVRWT